MPKKIQPIGLFGAFSVRWHNPGEVHLRAQESIPIMSMKYIKYTVELYKHTGIFNNESSFLHFSSNLIFIMYEENVSREEDVLCSVT